MSDVCYASKHGKFLFLFFSFLKKGKLYVHYVVKRSKFSSPLWRKEIQKEGGNNFDDVPTPRQKEV